MDFLIEFLNYCDKAILLRVFDKSVLGYEVFVDNKEFKNTIEFLDIFSELFWEKEIFPESEILIEAKKDLEKN